MIAQWRPHRCDERLRHRRRSTRGTAPNYRAAATQFAFNPGSGRLLRRQCSSTVSLMRMPALFAAVTRFCVAQWRSDDMDVSLPAVGRHADGIADAILVSTINSAEGHATLRGQREEDIAAASTPAHIVGQCREPAPTGFRRGCSHRDVLPATPMVAASTGMLATLSASPGAAKELTAESRLTMSPLRSLWIRGAERQKTHLLVSIREQHASLVLPISSPTRYWSSLPNALLNAAYFSFPRRRRCRGSTTIAGNTEDRWIGSGRHGLPLREVSTSMGLPVNRFWRNAR